MVCYVWLWELQSVNAYQNLYCSTYFVRWLHKRGQGKDEFEKVDMWKVKYLYLSSPFQRSQISKPMNSKIKVQSCHAFLLKCWSWSLINFSLKQGWPAGLFQNCSCLFTLYATNNPHKAHKMVHFFASPWLLQFQITFSCTVHILFCGGFFVLCITVRTKVR